MRENEGNQMRVEKSYMPNASRLGELRDALSEIIEAEGESAVISAIDYDRRHVAFDRFSVRCHIHLVRDE